MDFQNKLICVHGVRHTCVTIFFQLSSFADCLVRSFVPALVRYLVLSFIPALVRYLVLSFVPALVRYLVLSFVPALVRYLSVIRACVSLLPLRNSCLR